MKKILKQSLMLCIIFILLCGLIYPLAVTAIGQLLFKKQADGSILTYNGKKIGSSLIGQDFTDERFFHGRVSSINYNTYTKADTVKDSSGKVKYEGVTSGSSNLAPSNKALENRIEHDMSVFLKNHPGIIKDEIPEDLITNSGSGLDPEISIQAAKIQEPLISEKTGISVEELSSIVKKCTRAKSFGMFGEPGVNVLKVNVEIAKKLNIK